jgi:general stress protein CsbA
MTWLPFIDGLMPIQFFVELVGLILFLSGLSLVLSRAGMPVNQFWKAVGLFACIFLYLKYRVYPPMPFSLLATYVVVILAAILLWASSSEEYWQDFRRPIIATLDAETQTTKIIRAGLLIFLPILAWYLTWDSMLIKINEPVELRTVGPAHLDHSNFMRKRSFSRLPRTPIV